MKKIAILLFVCLAFVFQSCEEIGPAINLGGTGGNNPGTGQERKVLIEEFTGVQCVNCPEGSEQIEQLLGIHGSQLIAVSIHSGFFANPYPDSNYDFRTPEGTAIEAALGTAVGYPTASINRKIFENESSILVGRNKWAGLIASELQDEPMVEVNISKDFNTTSRLLEVTVDLSVIENISDPLLLSVMVTEDNIIDPQLTLDGKDPNYSHKHVLRGMLTNSTGAAYTGGTTNAGDSGSQTFSMTLPNGWDESNCNVIAFAHSGGDKVIYQANYVSILD